MWCLVNYHRPSSSQGKDSNWLRIVLWHEACYYSCTKHFMTPATEHQRRVFAGNYLQKKQYIGQIIKTALLKNWKIFSLSILVIFKSLFGKYGPWPWGPLLQVPFDCNCSSSLGTSPLSECVQEKAWWGFQGNKQLLSVFKSEILACWFCSFPSVFFGLAPCIHC